MDVELLTDEVELEVGIVPGLAEQLLTGEAASGPSVTGLQPGKASRTPETASLNLEGLEHFSAVVSG